MFPPTSGSVNSKNIRKFKNIGNWNKTELGIENKSIPFIRNNTDCYQTSYRENCNRYNRIGRKKRPIFNEKIFVTDEDLKNWNKSFDFESSKHNESSQINRREFFNNYSPKQEYVKTTYYWKNDFIPKKYSNFTHINHIGNPYYYKNFTLTKSSIEFDKETLNKIWAEIKEYRQQNKTNFIKDVDNLLDNKFSKFDQIYGKLYKNKKKSLHRSNLEVKKVKKLVLSTSDPIDLIHEKENFSVNMRWSPYLLSELSFDIPDEIINFEYEDELGKDLDGLDAKESHMLKEFVKMASDFSFLSGSSLNGAVCMYKAVLPLMLIRWKNSHGITTSKLDSIIKVMLGIPFFRYFEDKENMINTCINMFFMVDVNTGEGLGLRDSRFDSSIVGISIADFKVYQYYRNKKRFNEQKMNSNDEDRPHDSASLLEMIYDDICNYFYECMDEDLKEDIEEYIFQNAMIFDITENQRITIFKQNNMPFFPDISERRSSIDSLPSDKFLASLQEIINMNFELPELNFPGLNIRDLNRLYYYAGRIGLILPIRLILKMIYEISYFANHSTLLRQAYCTETLIKLTNFKLADVLCNVAFSSIPLKFETSTLLTKLEDIIKRVANSPSKWGFRSDPLFSKAELDSLENPCILSIPDFIQIDVIQDNWMLYRSLSMQLYGSIAVYNEENISSIISLIHSIVLGYIKLFWGEFKKLYIKVGVTDPELYYSLLLNQRRAPALIELIAFSRVYEIPIKVYTKVIENSSKKIEFHLEKEITELVEKLSSVEHSSDENFEKFWKGNSNKFVPCKVIRLLINKETSPGYYKDVLIRKNFINNESKITSNINDGSNWTWNFILPVYDKKTNEQILSQGKGIKIKYKMIKSNYIDFLNDLNRNSNSVNVFFPQFKAISNDNEQNNSWRKSSKYTYGKLLTNKIPNTAFLTKTENDEILNNDNKLIENTFEKENIREEFMIQYFVVIQPLITYLEVGVYESRIFMNKIFEDFPLFNWDKLPEIMDIDFLQNTIYIGDLNKDKQEIDLKNWKQDQITDISKTELRSQKDSESKSNLRIESESESDSELETFESLKESDFKSKSQSELIEEQERKNFKKIEDEDFNSRIVIIPDKKPWNNRVNLLEFNLLNLEPPFSFIPLKGNIPTPTTKKINLSKLNINLDTLFNLAKDFWMLPLEISSRTLFCFGKTIGPYIYNPNPEYIPEMLIYDKIISTVVSLLPVIDTSTTNLRPTAFIITVCEMALLDPIDLGPFLMMNTENRINGMSSKTPNELFKLFSQMPIIRDICTTVTKCIESTRYGNEYKKLINQPSESRKFNDYVPNCEQIIQIQQLVPRFPEIVIIVRNLLRIIHFIGRKGILLNKKTLYQIAKELAIAFHSISPYIWKSNIILQEIYNQKIKENRKSSKKTINKNHSYMPIYDEAYWGLYDHELLINTCIAILTTRNIMTYPAATIVCHYTFLRIPLSLNGISTSIPAAQDLDEDLRVAASVTFFYLRDFVSDPIKLIKSKEYNNNPMNSFLRIISEWELDDLKNVSIESDNYYGMFFTADFVLDMFVLYEDYMKLLKVKEYDLKEMEMEFLQNKSGMDYLSETGFEKMKYQNYFSEMSQNLNNFQYKNLLSEEKLGDIKFSSFWRYKPNLYKKSFKKSIFGSAIDDIFESVSVLLYSTNIYKDLVKSTFLSAFSLIKTICRHEMNILKNSKSDNAYIHVEGVDQETVLYILSTCSKFRELKIKKKRIFKYYEKEMPYLEVFELLQFIYKVPIMVYEINKNSNTVKDTELNNRIYELKSTNSLISSLRIARIYYEPENIFRYQPLIPKVSLNDYEELKNGVGPIPYKIMIRIINLIKNKNKNRFKSQFRRRTEFDEANDNYFNRKQIENLFSDDCINACTRNSFLPLLRRYIPFVPGDIEGKSLLQFIKMATAVIDLRRRPIKKLPDKNIEKTFKSLLLEDKEPKDSKDHLMNTYGINMDELIEKKKLSELDYNQENISKYDNTLDQSINLNTYKFIVDYFNNVRNTSLSSDVIHSFIEAERLKKNSEYIGKKPGIKELIYDFLKYTAVNIFSELYYYWNTFRVKFDELSNNTYKLTFKSSHEQKEEALREKQLKLYIEGKIDKIEI